MRINSLFLSILLLTGCATEPVMPDSQSPSATPAPKPPIINTTPNAARIPAKAVSASGYRAKGRASIYPLTAHGHPTSSGILHDTYGLTAAHATLPLHSRVRIINPKNQASITVMIIDRAVPPGNLIHLSHGAAQRLTLTNQSKPQVEVIGLP